MLHKGLDVKEKEVVIRDRYNSPVKKDIKISKLLGR
jgi:hypothetical protein